MGTSSPSATCTASRCDPKIRKVFAGDSKTADAGTLDSVAVILSEGLRTAAILGTLLGDVNSAARKYTGNDTTGFVVSLNLYRRHLTESQRAAAAAKLANLALGGRSASNNRHEVGKRKHG